MQYLLILLNVIFSQITYDTIGTQRMYSGGVLSAYAEAPIHGIASPQFTTYLRTSQADSITGTPGQIVLIQNDGYNKPAFFWWDTTRYSSAVTVVKQPKWMRINKHHNAWTMRQSSGKGAVNTTALKRCDTIGNASKGNGGFFGIRQRDLKEKNIVFKIIWNLYWVLNADANYADLSFRNGNDTSITWGAIRLNAYSNYISSGGYVANSDAMGWVTMELYSNSNQELQGSDTALFYTRTCLTTYKKGNGDTQPSRMIDMGCTEHPSQKIYTLSDIQFGAYAQWNTANTNAAISVNWIALDQGTP